MPKFDQELFTQLYGGNADPIGSLGVAYGVPRCMVNLAQDILKLLPSAILGGMHSKLAEAQDTANNDAKMSINQWFKKTGWIEFDTERGTFSIYDDSEGSPGLNDLGKFLEVINEAASLQTQVYNNFKATKKQIENIDDCIGTFKDWLDVTDNSTDTKFDNLSKEDRKALNESIYSREIKIAQEAKEFSDQVQVTLDNIQTILVERFENPDLEPCIKKGFAALLGESDLCIEKDTSKDEEEVFRLTFGPPEVKDGRLLLSIDGLYYDSQTSGGLDLALEHLSAKRDKIPIEERWTFDYDPNLGGKGLKIGAEQAEAYYGTIFDKNIVDRSPSLEKYYAKDGFLLVLLENKNKAISDINIKIKEFENTGAGAAVIENFKQSLLSIESHYEQIITKRLKQIEIAVKAPNLFGEKTKFKPGEIPVNDFSYLSEYNLAVELDKQTSLILNQNEVEGVVLPIKPKFTISKKVGSQGTTFGDLLISKTGIGYFPYESSAVSGQDGVPVRSTPAIVEDSLIGIYNFLNSEVVDTSSDAFVVNNSASLKGYNNAQLVGANRNKIFPMGLGVPYLEGITTHQPSSLNQQQASGVGSYVRLPDTQEYRDLTYTKEGFTVDLWAYVPTLMDPEYGWNENDVSSQHRLLLACENVGILSSVDAQDNILRMRPQFGNEVHRGLVMGFTRDNRMLLSQDPTNTFDTNTSSTVGFYVAATQARDASSAGFCAIGEDGCALTENFHSWSINVSSLGPNSVRFKDAANEFMHIALSVSPKEGNVKVFLDGELMGTSSINDVFGTNSYEPLRLPSLKKTNSFEYASSSVGASAGASLSAGPLLNDYFTPWIIGGGYTDGYASAVDSVATVVPAGNFMGGEYGGTKSGLKGHIGSLKFYSKALSDGEVASNYKAQRPLFKNIRARDNLGAKLFLLLGGQNAAGQASYDEIPEEYEDLKTIEFNNTYIWDVRNGKKWEKLKAQYNGKSFDAPWGVQTLFGPELTMAKRLEELYPDERIYLAKLAASGAYFSSGAGVNTGVFANDVTAPCFSHYTFGPDLSAHSFRQILSSTVDGTGLDLSADASSFLVDRGIENFNFGGAFILHGENDISDHDITGSYQGSFNSILNAANTSWLDTFRHDLTASNWADTTNIPIVITVPPSSVPSELSDNEKLSFLDYIRDTGNDASNEIRILELSSGYTLNSNNLDLDTKSTLDLGSALVELLYKPKD